MSLFTTLNGVNVNGHTEKKNGLTYLSWAWAWGEVKKIVPNAVYTIYERETEYGPVNYFTDGRTCWVKTGVTLDGLEHIEELPVMDYRNQSIMLDKVTSMDVNKAIQRSLTKACARHGLGLYIYAGEDLPEEEAEAKRAEDAPQTKEEIRKEIEKAKANPLNIDPNKPAPGQIKYMLEHFGPNELTKYRSTYGENLEGMTREQAVQMVTFLQKREERKAAAMA
jgi:hypothetical protein